MALRYVVVSIVLGPRIGYFGLFRALFPYSGILNQSSRQGDSSSLSCGSHSQPLHGGYLLPVCFAVVSSLSRSLLVIVPLFCGGSVLSSFSLS